MSCAPLPKAVKLVWAKQLTRLPCLVVYVKFQLVYTTKRLSYCLNSGLSLSIELSIQEETIDFARPAP